MEGDHSQAGRLFKLRKVLRYVRIYGLSKTWIKVRSQRHLKAAETFMEARWVNSDCRNPESPRRSVGIIGCGNFGFAHIGFYLRGHDSRFLRATYDVRPERALSLCKGFGGAYATANWRDILQDPQVGHVYIASNHASHTEYAVAALAAGKQVHVEKPVSVTLPQLAALREAVRAAGPGRLFAGYNRPLSGAVSALRGRLTAPQGPLTLSCFIAGHFIPADHWYRRPEEGTRICGNVGHWLDLAVHLLSWRDVPDRWRIRLNWSDPSARDDDLAISLTSESGDLVNIILTARSEPFEGINETINLQWGEVTAKIDDFRTLDVWEGAAHERRRYRPKDVGHRRAILQPFLGGRDWNEVELSSLLMLRIAGMVVDGLPDAEFNFSSERAALDGARIED